MSKRYAVLGLSIVLALALAVPALGGPSNPIANISASVKKTANKALKTAKQAKKTANTALSTANTAKTTADSANGGAKKAQEDAKKASEAAAKAQTTADGAQKTADEAKAAAAAAEANANTRVKGIYTIFGTSSASDTETTKNVSAFCNGDDESTGGGYAIAGAGANSVTVTAETPTFYGDGWFVTGQAISGTPTWSIQANAMCAEE